MSILSIFSLLEKTSGNNEKIKILSDNEDNTDFVYAVSTALDPYTTFFMQKIPSYETKESDTPIKLSDAIDKLVSEISTRNISGDAAREFVANILSSLSRDDANVLIRVIKKDLRCGIAEKMINKAWKTNKIRVYPCLLASEYSDKNISTMSFPAYSQLKADGARINFICERGGVTARTRSGKIVNLHGQFDECMSYLSEGESVVFDGELEVVDCHDNVLLRKIGNGIIQKAICGTLTMEEAKQIRAKLWDVIPLSDFINEKSTDPYYVRFSNLSGRIARNPSIRYELIENRIVNSMEEVNEHFQEQLLSGKEGVIIKNKNHMWENKRSKHLIKMKAEKECDLVITGWNKGDSGKKWENSLGSLICESADNILKVSVSGMPDSLRKTIYDNIEDFVGKVVTVKYNERITSDKKDTISLFLPRLVTIRYDKDTANNIDEIM